MKKILSSLCLIIILAAQLFGCAKSTDLPLGNLVILGDSYSTFEGHIPEGYVTYYSKGGRCGIKRVSDTWWHKLAVATKSDIILNSSYSGSTVCHTGYYGNDYSEFSFAARVTKLVSDGFFEENSIDTIIIYGGLNDFWANSPRGEIKYEGITDEDLYSFFPALSYIFKAITEATPNTRLVLIIEEQLDGEMKDGMRSIADHYGVQTVEPHGLELEESHPTKKGMKSLSEQIIASLSADN